MYRFSDHRKDLQRNFKYRLDTQFQFHGKLVLQDGVKFIMKIY